VSLGKGAPAALAIFGLLIILLAFDIVPPPIAAVLCATLMVITGVLTPSQLYRGIDWSTCILIGAMIPPAVALSSSGAAALIGNQVVGALGGAGPYAVLAAIFAITALITQFISNPAAALVMMPIGLATANELSVHPLPMMLAVAMGASASFLTPFANGVSARVYAPGGYTFEDFWKLGLVVMAWTMLVTVLIVPLVWSF
jgi:di/tricarboxylate transporter